MHKLLYDRVRLIRGLQLALNNGFSDQEKAAIANIVTTIRTDHHHHFLSYSQEEIGKVSYAMHVRQQRQAYAFLCNQPRQT